MTPAVQCAAFGLRRIPGQGAVAFVRAVSPQLNEGRPFCATVTLTEPELAQLRASVVAAHNKLHATTAGVAPPGMEHVVRALKRQPGVRNPWAVAWRMRQQAAGLGFEDPMLLTANYEFKTIPFKMGREIIDIGTGEFKINPFKMGGNMLGYTPLWGMGTEAMDPFKMGTEAMDPFKMGTDAMDPFKMGFTPISPWAMGTDAMDPFKMGGSLGAYGFAMGRQAQVAAAARTVTAAKRGSPAAKKAIAVTKVKAHQGHPGAKQAMRDMRAVDAAQKRRAAASRRRVVPTAPARMPAMPRLTAPSGVIIPHRGGGLAHGIAILQQQALRRG